MAVGLFLDLYFTGYVVSGYTLIRACYFPRVYAVPGMLFSRVYAIPGMLFSRVYAVPGMLFSEHVLLLGK
jgi:hypothetical protein